MMKNNFCVDGSVENPKCYKVETFDFASEEQIIDVLLDLLKSELPSKMAELKDCSGNPMLISEDAIDIIPPEGTHKYRLLLNLFGDEPEYAESKMYRKVAYTFEMIISVGSQQYRCVTWELLRFKNAIEGIIVGAEFEIDGYNSVDIVPEGIRYLIPEESAGLYWRDGIYRFSVTVGQYRT